MVGSTGGSYNLVALIPALRYTVAFGDHLGLFIYGGMMGSLVFSAVNSNPNVINALDSFFPAVGAGLLFQIGPGWYTRLDAGLESLAINLMLRF